MLTYAAAKGPNRASFQESDLLRKIDLPPGGNLTTIASSIESAMEDETTGSVRRACAHFLAELAGFYEVPACGVRVLAARPLRVLESSTIELFWGLQSRHAAYPRVDANSSAQGSHFFRNLSEHALS